MNSVINPLQPSSVTSLGQSILKIQGGYSLSGQVKISGAKNSALALMAATLLCSDECQLRNVPSLVDIRLMNNILSALGVKVHMTQDIVTFDARVIDTVEAPYELVSKMRGSFFIIGPLLGRMGEARVPMPGGCSIGSRPVDLHVRGLQALGAEVNIEHGVVHARAKNGRRLVGAKIYLDFPSVGATENIMMAAALAEGETIIENAAQEPEIVDLAGFCNAMGANIEGAGTHRIVIQGVKRMHTADYRVIPDRIEAASFILAGAITRSSILVNAINVTHLTSVLAKLNDIGIGYEMESPTSLRVLPSMSFRGTDVETLPHPGFPTDVQSPFMALLSIADGNSVITETLFENRMQHVAELTRMGADIKVKGNLAIIKGVPMLSGAPVVATDLRASAALVLAGLAAQGETIVSGLHHMDRGYDRLESKMAGLGAKIVRVNADSVPGLRSLVHE
ncbi:MAG: UDP-N-acetylglucosamine 1-carboxyvinyltransferase [Alkalinema sp. FL-bin-369]|nr:UDP-N-acetylglucosamine 1-carboxyvinyltransferase [Leptolyngbyaceae cyanobacterium LF-bin-369]